MMGSSQSQDMQYTRPRARAGWASGEGASTATCSTDAAAQQQQPGTASGALPKQPAPAPASTTLQAPVGGSQPSQAATASDSIDSMPKGPAPAGGSDDMPGDASGSRRCGRKNRHLENAGGVVPPFGMDQDSGNVEDSEKAVRNARYQSQFFKTKVCTFWQRNQCTLGQACKYAHGALQLKTMPDLTNTSMCHNMTTKGGCSIEGCPFAHNPAELRATEQLYKTMTCSFSLNGSCSNGSLCRHAHNKSELRKVPQGAPDKGATSSKVDEEDDLNRGMNSTFMGSCVQPESRKSSNGMLVAREFTHQTSQPDPAVASQQPPAQFVPLPGFLIGERGKGSQPAKPAERGRLHGMALDTLDSHPMMHDIETGLENGYQFLF